MANNFLQLNADKTEVLMVASDSIASSVVRGIGLLSLAVLSSHRNVCVVFDQEMHFEYMFISLKKLQNSGLLFLHRSLKVFFHVFMDHLQNGPENCTIFFFLIVHNKK